MSILAHKLGQATGSEHLFMRSQASNDGFLVQKGCFLFHRHALFLPYTTPPAKDYSIQNQTKSLLAQLLCQPACGKTKSAPLKALRKQAVAGSIPRHHLQIIFTTIEKSTTRHISSVMCRVRVCSGRSQAYVQVADVVAICL